MTVEETTRPSLWDTLQRGATDLRSVSEELPGIVAEVQGLAKSDIELGMVELQETASQTGNALVMAVVGVVLADIGLVFLFMTVMFALSTAMELWIAALITTAIIAGLSFVAIRIAMARFQTISPVPQRFVRSVGKDISWLKSQMNWSGS